MTQAERAGWRVPLRMPDQLTDSPLKAFHYNQECYFREAWNDFAALAGGADAAALATKSSFVLFKPDGIVARAVEPTLSLLTREGFTPVASTTFRFDRLLIRELWRYDLNLATLSRLDTIDRFLLMTPSLLVLLRDETTGPMSAAARLAKLKGPSLQQQRTPLHLRHMIRARDGLLNFIHTPDEPADMMRELGVLLPRTQRMQLFDALWSSREFTLDRSWETSPQHDLELEPATSRITQALALCAPSPQRALVEEACAQALRGQSLESRPVIDALARLALPVDAWDEAVLLIAITDCSLSGILPFLSMPAEVPSYG